jgi:hypothetical protein
VSYGEDGFTVWNLDFSMKSGIGITREFSKNFTMMNLYQSNWTSNNLVTLVLLSQNPMEISVYDLARRGVADNSNLLMLR